MYLQVTSKCNMMCPHCAFSCTEEGEDMSLEVFEKAAELAFDADEYICIGGGEPTIHPQFWAIVGIALGLSSEDAGVFMVTNGKNTEIALRLANMAKRGILGVRLSRDQYHELIDPSVYEAFTKPKETYLHTATDDLRDIGYEDMEEFVIAQGRAKEWGTIEDRCICPEVFVTPNGDIYECGCLLEKIGNVWDGYEMPDIYTNYDVEFDERCTKQRMFEEEKMEQAELLHA